MKKTMRYLAVVTLTSSVIFLLAACLSTPTAGAVSEVWSGFPSGSPEAMALATLEKGAGTPNTPEGMGWSVAASADGTIWLDNGFTFMKDGSGSIGICRLMLGDTKKSSTIFYEDYAVNLLYGAATAVSADGSLVVIGAPGKKADDTGYVLGYIRSDNGWTSDKNKYPLWFRFPAMGKGWLWGMDLALSGNGGTTLLIGAPAAEGHGRAMYFLAPAGGWAAAAKDVDLQNGYLGAGDAQPGDEFGRSVAISKDDSTIVIGAPGKNNGTGQVYVFKRPAGGWTKTTQHFILASESRQAGGRFGQSVAVSNDGSVIAIGAPGDLDGVGAVYVVSNFESENDAGKIATLESDKRYLGNGIAVEVSGDGRTIASGGFGIEYSGSVKVYRSESGNWTDSKIIGQYAGSPDKEGQKGCMLGYSVALTEDGSRLLAGIPFINNGQGEALWFDLSKR